MASESISVKTVWLDKNNKQVGVRITVGEREQDIPMDVLKTMRSNLNNAVVTKYGVRGKAGVVLPRKALVCRGSSSTKAVGNDSVVVDKIEKTQVVGVRRSHINKNVVAEPERIDVERLMIPIEIENGIVKRHRAVKYAKNPYAEHQSVGCMSKLKLQSVECKSNVEHQSVKCKSNVEHQSVKCKSNVEHQSVKYKSKADKEVNLSRGTGRPVETYTLMHGNDEVCNVYPTLNSVDIENDTLLPFALRGVILTVPIFLEWLNRRIDNLARTYMNKVYIARKVGRDREKILRDSCAISILDNFWVKRSDVDTSWEELKCVRDQNLDLVNTALTGLITESAFKAAIEDTTSLFTIKGAFPKAIYKGYILKKDNNAAYEIAAHLIGKSLNIAVADAVEEEDSGIIKCRIFTSETVSMAHAQDFLNLAGYGDEHTNELHMVLYDYFKELGRRDIVLQLERLYLLNYLTLNMDLHEENFGFLYDSETFELLGVAPAYDFNSAFGEWEDISTYYYWIFENLATFMQHHQDIRERLQSVEFLTILETISDLTEDQKKCIQLRADYLRSLGV